MSIMPKTKLTNTKYPAPYKIKTNHKGKFKGEFPTREPAPSCYVSKCPWDPRVYSMGKNAPLYNVNLCSGLQGLQKTQIEMHIIFIYTLSHF